MLSIGEVRMESAEIGGLRLAYEVKGSDRNGTVVLAGGSGMPPLVWELCGLNEALMRPDIR